MIVKIKQIHSNVKQQYDIESDNFYFKGVLGNLSRLQTITMSGADTVIKGTYKISPWYNYIPLLHLFGITEKVRNFLLYKNENFCGSVMLLKQGIYKSCYRMELSDGKTFSFYCRSKGSFNYVSVYYDNIQIALIETYLCVTDFKYTHKLYICDSFSAFADFLSFFVLYYAGFTFTKRFHMQVGSTYAKSWSVSRYNSKYDEKWREKNFPDDNFFGKTSLSVDKEKI